jgi:chromosomal replication initiator protein
MSYLDDISNIWESVKASLLQDLGQQIITLWLDPLKVYSYDNNKITLSVETEFNLKVVKERYINIIASGFSLMLGFDVDVDVIFTGKTTDVEQLKKQIRLNTPTEKDTENDNNNNIKRADDQNLLPQNYNFQYTFDNFIVGNSNKFAHAACTAVAERPAMDYNPLFIYGPSGLGKTHLMSAVVNEIRRKKPDTRVVYIKGDEFTNEMIESLSKHEMSKFHEKYRNCDILLIDDIQFIAGKDSTQEEFFHTFNNLYESNKQIILTSDRPPKDIQTLEDRLKTRFEWGLIADIQPPDIELRVAIIKKKAEQININIPDDVLNFLAENLRSNIRQLEGAIKKLSAKCFLSGQNITMDMAKNCIAELLGGAEPINVTVDKIFTAVFKKYGINKEDLLGTKRNKDIAQARHISIYLIRTITEMSFPNIGKMFNRDHTTAMASSDRISEKIAKDPLFNLEIESLIKDVTD